jgi:hypothetical protein
MPKPTPRWREYQREVAEFFESLGFVATVDAAVQGVRSMHDIDVLVEFNAFGVGHRWLVECKAWNRPVPKERVEILKSIVQETGSDRGFLLCEKHFQSGAVTAARISNVTLTSLADLRVNAEADLADIKVRDLFSRWFDWNSRWHNLSTTSGESPSLTSHLKAGVSWHELTWQVNAMSAVEAGLTHFRVGRFPAPYAAIPDDAAPHGLRVLRAASPAEFLESAEQTISAAEAWLREQEAKPWPKGA